MSAIPEHQSLSTLTDRAFREVLPALGPHYNLRPEQYRYAMCVAENIAREPVKPGHANVRMLEGGTGTGKTLGYLIPAGLHAALTGERVGIGTHTLALQDQMFGREALLSGRQPDFRAGDVSDLAVAIEVIRRITGVTLRAAFRKGRHVYLSPSVALKKIHEQREAGVDKNPDKAARLDEMEKWALHVLDVARQAGTLTSESREKPDAGDAAGIAKFLAEDPYQGLIDSWLDAGNVLPEGITAGDISLANAPDDGENPWYQEHTGRAGDAQIIVFSHTMRLLDLMTGGKILPEFGVVIHDEADTLGDVANGWLHQRFRPVSLMHEMRAARPAFSRPFEKNEVLRKQWDTLYQSLDAAREDLRALYDESPGKEWFVAPGSTLADRLMTRYRGLRAQIRPLVKSIEELAPNSLTRNLRGKTTAAKRRRELLAALKASADALGRILPRLALDPAAAQEDLALEGEKAKAGKRGNDFWKVVALSWSPKIALASVETVDLYPGRIFGQQWRKPSGTRLVLLTSATLRVPTSATSDEWVFMRTMVGIDRIQTGDTEEPDAFGEIRRIVQVAGIPAPFLRPDKDEDGDAKDTTDLNAHEEPEAQYDPQWLDLTAAALRMLADEIERTGGSALVHAASFRDVRTLAERIGDDRRFWMHTGNDLAKEDGILALQNGDSLVLVTPSLHAGANIRARDGGQLLTHIAILRLPLPPRDDMMLGAMEQNLTMQGVDEPRKVATRKLYRVNENKAIHRMAQQIGRGIRASDDRIDVWVLDPRFPLDKQLAATAPPKVCRPRDWRWQQVFPRRFREQMLRNAKTLRVLVPDEHGGCVLHSPARGQPKF